MREVNEKPPLGIAPRYIIDEQRAREIIFGILRFIDARRPVPREWLEELFDRVNIKEEGGEE
jgi:hypothetical protein